MMICILIVDAEFKVTHTTTAKKEIRKQKPEQKKTKQNENSSRLQSRQMWGTQTLVTLLDED